MYFIINFFAYALLIVSIVFSFSSIEEANPLKSCSPINNFKAVFNFSKSTSKKDDMLNQT